jgi:hypothetical protein
MRVQLTFGAKFGMRKQRSWEDKSQEEIGQMVVLDENLMEKLADNHMKHAKGEIPLERCHSCKHW